jgi:hemolysin activation/secretion protein
MVRPDFSRPLAWIVTIVAAATLLYAAPPATAQAPPSKLPGAAEPGRQTPPSPQLPAGPVKLKWTIDLPAGGKVPKALADETLTLKDIVFDGLTVYRREDLLGLFQNYLGKTITFAEFYGIAGAIQTRYHRDGYLLSFAYVPPQTVENDVYTIAVVEGFVDKVVVEGVGESLKRRLTALMAPISRSRPLKTDVLERYLLLGNDLAGIAMTGVLQPSKQVRGASELVVKATHDPFDASVALNNRGSEFAGPGQATVRAGVNSLLGQGERIGVNATVTQETRELRSAGLEYGQPIGTEGMRLKATAALTRSRPGFTLQTFGVITTSANASIDLSYPLIRTRARSLTLSGGLSLLNTNVHLLGENFRRDKIRSARAGLSYSHSGFLGGNSGATLSAVQGLPLLDHSDPDEQTMSRADAEPAFTKLTLGVVHTQPLPAGFDLNLNASGQYSLSALAASEEFAVGGAAYGRAYNGGEITGEHGAALALELGYEIPYRDTYIRRAKPYIFYDVGKTWDKATPSATGINQSLASGGVGIRVNLPKGATFDLEYARPLTRKPSNQSTDRYGRLFVFLGFKF